MSLQALIEKLKRINSKKYEGDQAIMILRIDLRKLCEAAERLEKTVRNIGRGVRYDVNWSEGNTYGACTKALIDVDQICKE